MRRFYVSLFFITSCLISNAQEYVRMLSSSTQYDISNQENVEITQVYKLKILSKEGYKYAIYRNYEDEFRKIKHVSITVRDKSDNKIKKINQNDGVELGMSPSYEINDSKILIIDPEYQDYPFTIDVESTVKLKGFISLPTWLPRPHFNMAVNQATLKIIYPNNLSLSLREEVIEKTDSSIVEGKKVIEYQANNLSAIDKKLRYKDFYKDQPKVLVTPKIFELDGSPGSMHSWRDFGDWFYKLNNTHFELTEDTKSYINKLANHDIHERIKNIYQYMQDKTRYVSIQLGIGGFKSLPTEEVEEFGYGDCKALTTYMKNMLDYTGIKSNYILVRAGEDAPDVKADFPSNQFNHVFLGVPVKEDTLYLECTSQMLPMNYTGKFTDDRNVLWVEKSKSSIIRSRKYTHDQNSRVNHANIKLDEQGNGYLQLKTKNRGVFFDELMTYKTAPEDLIQKHNNSKFYYNDFTIKEFSFNHSDRDKALFETNFSMELPGLCKKAGERIITPLNFLVPVDKLVDHNDLFKYADIKRGITIKDSTTVSIPDNFWVYNAPEEEKIESEIGEYTIEVAVKGNELIIQREVIFYSGTYRGDTFEEFKEFLNKVEKVDKRKLVLNTKT